MVPGSTVHVLFSKISFWLAVTTFSSLISTFASARLRKGKIRKDSCLAVGEEKVSGRD